MRRLIRFLLLLIPLSSFAEGFVVWESNRTGPWRIWRRDLNGAELRQISPDNLAGDHAGPAISPDGRWVAFLHYPPGSNHNDNSDNKGAKGLYLIPAEGGELRRLQEHVHKTGRGNRVVVWTGPETLHFIDREGLTRSLHIHSGAVSAPLVNGIKGVLLNPTRTAAFGDFHFHLVHPQTGELTGVSYKFGGCEPYVTHDGRWGYRVNGAGGPFIRIDLSNGEFQEILRKHDPRLHKEYNYIYFPMVSNDRTLLAFAASPNQHDHSKSNYEVFVAPLNPETLELSGEPVRYTFHENSDRYPDVFSGNQVPPTPIPEFSPGPRAEPATEAPVFVWPAPGLTGKAVGTAIELRDGAYAFRQGYLLLPEQGATLSQTLRRRNELSLEALVTSYQADQRGPARLFSLSRDTGARNLTLGQEGGNLVLRVRTTRSGNNGSSPQLTLGPIPPGQPVLVLFTYRDGQSTAYLNGVKTLDSSVLNGRFSNWEPMELILGDEHGGARAWQGEVSRVRIYDRVLSEAEIAAAIAQNAADSPSPAVRVRMTVKEVSPAWDPKVLLPYTRGLSTFRAQVEAAESADLNVGQAVSVATWSVLNGQPQPLPKPGETLDLWIEAIHDQHYLKSEACLDQLEEIAPFFWYALPNPVNLQ